MRLTLYKVLSYILLPIAAYIGLITLLTLFAAFSNFQLLFSVFICGATVIYVFTSFAFLRKGLLRNLPFKHGVKDLIKVNGYVALVLSIFGLISGMALLVSPEIIQMVIDSLKNMNNEAVKSADLNAATLKKSLYLMVAFCLLLFFHILLTFYYIRKNSRLFIHEEPK
jgi:hypothetical protein